MTLFLRDDFKRTWQSQDVFRLLNTMEGETFRDLEARRTFRFEFQDKGFFAKVHKGVGWKEIVENLLRFRKPVLGARNEWDALNKLHALGIDTMTPVAFGERGNNPASQQSFLVTEELSNMLSLEELCEQWQDKPPTIQLKRAVVDKLADISRTLHNNGINHRDYYFCHFLTPAGSFEAISKGDKAALRLYLIDLHRARIRHSLPARWRIKDLSGLYYSAMDYGFTQRDIYRFIKRYTGQSLKEALHNDVALWKKTEEKAKKLYARMIRKAGHPNY
ncbi:lipopolysaccharide core heptose(I) kinase RfaP [Candidatus Sororendozoicomonas aggregata]|uniref:lipopolysaccharide core heptose(I) kinase RfaP n=1 Tax=Candidatus Sororendozoicomonas aggregata TaxID=3073239 RepID=UPI002ED4F076